MIQRLKNGDVEKSVSRGVTISSELFAKCMQAWNVPIDACAKTDMPASQIMSALLLSLQNVVTSMKGPDSIEKMLNLKSKELLPRIDVLFVWMLFLIQRYPQNWISPCI